MKEKELTRFKAVIASLFISNAMPPALTTLQMTFFLPVVDRSHSLSMPYKLSLLEDAWWSPLFSLLFLEPLTCE